MVDINCRDRSVTEILRTDTLCNWRTIFLFWVASNLNYISDTVTHLAIVTDYCPEWLWFYLVFKPLKCVAAPGEQLLRISVSFVDAVHFLALELLEHQSWLQTSDQPSKLPHCSSSGPNFLVHSPSNTKSQQLKAKYCRAANNIQISWWQFNKSINKVDDAPRILCGGEGKVQLSSSTFDHQRPLDNCKI